MKILVLVVALSALTAAGCNRSPGELASNNSSPVPRPEKRAKNIVLLIGDGMGLAQISAGLYSNNNKLQIERLPVIGLHKSYAYDDLITDSAAGATAFACGQKTYNGAIAVHPKDTTALPTILEEAETNGLRTGLVATSTIVHATPASFIAHAASRKEYEKIATYFLETDIDFFVGGGKKYFDRRELDDRNLIEELIRKNYLVSDYFQQDLESVTLGPGVEKFAYFTADDDPLPARQGRNYLNQAAAMALDHLSQNNDKGFFLMIEGSQIDWGGHANDSDYIITEMLDFDRMIGTVIDWAERDGKTLVIITADHETGGYAINPGSTMEKLETGFTSDYHTGTMIPVFAMGPGQELFAGIYENTAIYHKMRSAIGFRKTVN